MASPMPLYAAVSADAKAPGADARRLPAAGWRLAAPTAALWALAVAVLMSTQYLVQPFVWANWPVDDVLLGWLDVARDRVLVALAIAIALVLATRAPARRPLARALLVATAIVAGAIAGELVLRGLGAAGEPAAPRAVAGRIAQWAGISACVAAIYFLWARQRAADAATRASELARSASDALAVRTQLQALRQQIDPHFLFNTLATVRVLGESDVLAGGRLLGSLVSYLQSTIASAREQTTLGEEADLAASYLDIVATRMSGRLRYAIDVPDALRAYACPPLTVATLVENAVKHGITPASDGGTIAVSARRDGDTLELIVADTGVGIMAAVPGSHGGAGIGLANVRARLRALHGPTASLAILGNVPHGVRAVIRMPLSTADA